VSAELVRYLIAGVVNSLTGYLVFLGALRLAGLDMAVANVLSYAAGLMVAFVLNRAFVFKDSVHTRAAALKFLAGFAVAFAVNSGVLHLAHGALGLRAELAQLCAMAAYTVTFYLINKHVVFANRRGDDLA
jgi:putative flippase GtrA